MNELTGFQRDMLLVIAGLDEPNGLEVNDHLQNYYETEILHGRLYPNLDELVDRGLVNKGQHDLRTNKYELSNHGKKEVELNLKWRLSCIPNEIIDRANSLDPDSQNS
ncbi:helix-turn-helix transcriptional regulator [Halalkalicoccus tibetensis]|uniref:Helix-turn-helix transcriptional regulator n=1 Tax=Halalkalicoccus tibetensis TaxID=175632 RepID=A0ABD5V2V3_9EURY